MTEQLQLITPSNEMGRHKETPVVGKITFAPSPEPPVFVELTPNGQTVVILRYLKSGHSITPIEALEKFGCFRLGARIWDLKRMGHKIETVMVETASGKRVARYTLNKGE